MSDEQSKGQAFEAKVGELLAELQSQHPDVVHIVEQPRFELHDGQELIPDFELQFDLLYEEGHYLIECQDRKRSSPQIAQKIKYMKGVSSRNRFIFVYATDIPEATRNALAADGVMHMSFDDFVFFITRMHLALLRQGDPESLRRSDFDDVFRGYYPKDRGPEDFDPRPCPA